MQPRKNGSIFHLSYQSSQKNILLTKYDKKILALFGLATALIVSAAQAQTTIANWTFEPDPLPANVTNAAIGPFSPAVGSGSVTGLHAIPVTLWSSPAGNGSANSLNVNAWTTGDYFQFQFSTLTFSNIGMTWSQTRSSTGPSNFLLRYSTDGSSFTTFTNYVVAQVTWSSTVFTNASVFVADLTSVTAIDNQSDVYFRLAADQTAAGGGTGRIDDITITGIPQPSTIALQGLAAAGLGAHLIRRRRR